MDQRGTMRGNPLRLFFALIASTLLNALRGRNPRGTDPTAAECQSIRLKLLKLGALMRAGRGSGAVFRGWSEPLAWVFRGAVLHGQVVPGVPGHRSTDRAWNRASGVLIRAP